MALLIGSFGCQESSGSDTNDGADSGDTGDAPLPLQLGELDSDRGFAPYRDGDEELIIRGLQGGFHIFVDGRVLGPNADSASEYLVGLTLTYDDGEELTRIEHLRTPELTDTENNPTLPEMIIFIPDPDAAADQDVQLVATLDDAVGSDPVMLHLVRDAP